MNLTSRDGASRHEMRLLVTQTRQAIRALARRPALTIPAILTLALGIGGSTALFSVVDTLFFRAPPFVRAPEEVVRVYVRRGPASSDAEPGEVGDYPHFVQLRDRARAFRRVAAVASAKVTVGEGADAFQATAALVTPSFFPLLGVRPLAGRFYTEADERARERVAIVSEGFAARVFGPYASVLGREVLVARRVYTVVGVAPRGFTGVDLTSVDLWLPIEVAGPELGYALQCSDCAWLRTVARLRPGVTRQAAAAEASSIFRALAGSDADDRSATLVLSPVQAARGPLRSQEAKVALWLAAIATVVLLIACANVGNLLLARAVERRGEAAVRLALGATRWQLASQVLSEAMVLALGGGILGLVIAGSVTPLLSHTLLPPYAIPIALDLRMLALAAFGVWIAAVLTSVLGIMHAMRSDMHGLVAPDQRSGGGFAASWARNTLVTAQFAMAFVLVVGSAALVVSFRAVSAVPLGFDAEHLISARVNADELGYGNPDVRALYERMRERVSRLAGVSSAALAIGSPFGNSKAVPIEVPGVDLDRVIRRAGALYFQAVSPEYFRTLGTRVLHGRTFDSDDRRGAPFVVVVNRTMARSLWGESAALGQCVEIASDVLCRRVVGVVEDVRRHSLLEGPTMQYYIPLDQVGQSIEEPVSALLVRTAGPASGLVGSVRREVQATAARLPYPRILTGSELFEHQLRPRRIGYIFFCAFGTLAAALALVGVFGTTAYAVVQRRHEIAVRMALGTTPRGIVRLITRRALSLAFTGILIGAVATPFLGTRLGALLYDIRPTDLRMLVGAGLVLLFAALLSSYGPAYKAARLDVAAQLRQ